MQGVRGSNPRTSTKSPGLSDQFIGPRVFSCAFTNDALALKIRRRLRPNEVARRVFPNSTVKRFAQEVSVTRVPTVFFH